MSKNYINNLISDPYYKNLLALRDTVSSSCDDYFHSIGGRKVDLYLISNCISSPIGKGSDSKSLVIKFGSQRTALVDSSQFGLELLVLKHFEVAYCYLPSFRGERPDGEHLNQFFHCEAELRGNLKKVIKIASGLVKYIARDFLKNYENRIFRFKCGDFCHMEDLAEKKIPAITFEEAWEILSKQLNSNLFLKQSIYGRTFLKEGEKKIVEIVTNNKLPLWITNYDRDVVAFYQKPYTKDKNKVMNADLIFPSINGSFGGEIVGAGQRQDCSREIIESMRRQKVEDRDRYRWYINLRNNRNYKMTSGFGLGIERFIAWMIGRRTIAEVIIFPRKLNGSLNP